MTKRRPSVAPTRTRSSRPVAVKPVLSAKDVTALARKLGISRVKLGAWLEITAEHVHAADEDGLDRPAIVRIQAITDLIQMAERISAPATDTHACNAARWVGDWLDSPNPALGGIKPYAYLDTRAHRDALGRLLVQAATGVMA